MRWWSSSSLPQLRGVLSLIGGFFLHLTLGTIFCFGNMNTYMASFLRHFVHSRIAYSDMIWIPAVTLFMQGSCMTLGGILDDRIGLHATLFLGSVVLCLGVALTSVTVAASFGLTVLTYGAVYGLGIAVAYAPPLRVAMQWFPESKGLANGIVVSGFGMGAFVFNQVQTMYLNPKNKDVGEDGYFSDEAVLLQVPSVFILLATVYGIIQTVSILLISEPPPSMKNEEGCSSKSTLQDERTTLAPRPLEGEQQMHPGEIIRTRQFWSLWVTFFLNVPAIIYMNSMYKAFGQTLVKDDHFLAIVGALASVCNASGRIVWGVLCDRLGYRTCMSWVTVTVCLLYATFYPLSVIGGKGVYAVWVWAIFFCFSASYVLLPTATAHCFGTENSSKNYGLVTTAYAISSLIVAALTQSLSPYMGWIGMFLIVAAFSLASAVVTYLWPPMP